MNGMNPARDVRSHCFAFGCVCVCVLRIGDLISLWVGKKMAHDLLNVVRALYVT